VSDSDAQYFARLGQRFSEAQDRLLENYDARAAVRERLFAGKARSSSVRLAGAAPSRGVWRFALVPALALVATLVFWVGPFRDEAQPLSFQVGESRGQAGQLLIAPESAAMPLRFSDGSLLELDPLARSRVLEVEHNGARVELERGSVRASVVHRSDTAWAVVAGPFKVAVTGTKFVTRWDPQSRELEVAVEEGSVLVSGGSLRAVERVTRGKTLRISLGTTALQPSRQKLVPEAAPVTSGSPAAKAPSGASAKPPSSDPDAFRAVFESGSPTDLVTLSKELQKRGDLRGAARALTALRTRFPSDPRSGVAAQTLAELALARGDCGAARRYWDAYRAHAPSARAPSELGARVRACGGAQ
jgi:ferric-dicitrate binding protein FerR (iron transport regulator)